MIINYMLSRPNDITQHSLLIYNKLKKKEYSKYRLTMNLMILHMRRNKTIKFVRKLTKIQMYGTKTYNNSYYVMQFQVMLLSQYSEYSTCYYVPCHVIWLAKNQSFVEGGKLAGPVSKSQRSTDSCKLRVFVSQFTTRQPCSRCDPKLQNCYAYGIFGCLYSAYIFY